MKVVRAKGLAKFEKLNDELRTAETSSFGATLPRGIERQRKLLVLAIASNRSSGFRIGQLVARYRDHYKIDQAWMPIGKSIALSLGYKSYTSLNSLMKAAKNASRIPETLLAAVIDLGIDPAENKYRQLMNELQSVNFSGSDEEARGVAQVAIEQFRTRKRDAAAKRKEEEAASAAEFGNRIARQVAINVRNMPVGERKGRAEKIMRQIDEAIRTEMPGCSIQVAWVEGDSTTEVVKPILTTSTSPALSPRGELLQIRGPAAMPAMSIGPDVTPAALIDDRSSNSRGARAHRKLSVRSIEINQLSLFDGPARAG